MICKVRLTTGEFQHTAARRRLLEGSGGIVGRIDVSTHSRPKAAAGDVVILAGYGLVSTHSRPKAAAL